MRAKERIAMATRRLVEVVCEDHGVIGSFYSSAAVYCGQCHKWIKVNKAHKPNGLVPKGRRQKAVKNP